MFFKKRLFLFYFKIIFPIFLIGYGLLASYKEAFSLWRVDGDIAIFPVMTRYFLKGGWSAVESFRFPIDNWFFSLIIPYGTVFHFFGEQATVLIILGVVVFWLTAFFTGFLVFELSGLSRALWSVALILAASKVALGKGGFLLYSVSHNISMVWGLLGLLLCVLSLKRHNIFLLGFSVIIFSLASFSDPWMLPVFVIPIIISAFIMSTFESNLDRPLYIAWIIAGIFIIAFAETHCFGFFYIHEVSGKEFTSVKLSLITIPIMGASISYYFNFIPFLDFDKFYDVYRSVGQRNIIIYYTAMFINCSLFLYVLYVFIYSIKRVYQHIEKNKLFVIMVLSFSVLGVVSSSFLVGAVDDIRVSRYLVNIYYGVIVCFCLFPLSELKFRFHREFYILVFLFILSNIYSNISIWEKNNYLSSFEIEDQVLSFLNDEHIRYAYGDYWGLEAHAITWKSHYEKAVRPTVYLTDYRGFVPTIWTSSTWYHVPSSQKWAFVLTNIGSDDRTCLPFPSCREAVLNQFGVPLYIKERKQLTFFVYEGDKMNIPYGINVDNWKNPLPISYGSSLSWKDFYFYPTMGLVGNRHVLDNNWKYLNYGAMSIGEYASVHLPVLDKSSAVAKMWVHLSSNKLTPQHVEIIYKGKVISQWTLPSTESIYYLELPIDSGQNSLDYQFHILNYSLRQKPANGIRLYRVKLLDQGR